MHLAPEFSTKVAINIPYFNIMKRGLLHIKLKRIYIFSMNKKKNKYEKKRH